MARRRRQAGARIVGVIRLDRAALLRGTALQSVFMLSLMVPTDGARAQLSPNARPQGGAVVAGAASISNAANLTSINQSSQNTAINWKSFNVGSAQTVQFNQPNSKAIVVNRVQAGDPSQIAGHINANGVFVLTNPSGVVFANGAQVNAASVLVTTAGISNQNLMAGKMIFDQPGKPGAMIINKGQITVAQAGLAALVAPGVANAGVIRAPMGHVVLAGAEAHVIDLYGDGLMSIDVTKQVTTVPLGPDGKPVSALVTNSGVITATGGTVLLTARAVDGIVTTLVDAGGKILADTAAGGQTGTIVMNGVGGSLMIEGQVSAAGKAAGAKGGAIELNASNAVSVTATARVSASGRAGGGTVAMGTSLARAAGGPSVTGAPVAKVVTIAPGAHVSADAKHKGKGGSVTVLSTDRTAMAGTITAKGGANGGDGGFVEVSGHGGYALTGVVDVAAPMGNAGTILLDPANLVIVAGTSSTGNLDGSLSAHGSIAVSDSVTATDTVSTGVIGTLAGTIILAAGTSLSVANNTPLTLHSDASLVLVTDSGNITTGTLSPIVASGTGGIFFNAGTSTGASGSISLGSNLTTDATGSITLHASGGINLGTVAVTTGLLDLMSGGTAGVSQAIAGTVAAGTLLSAGGVAGVVSLLGSANAVGTVGAFAATNGFTLTNAGSLSVTGTLSSTGSVVLTNGTFGLAVPGAITAAALQLSAGSIDLGGSLGVTNMASLTANVGGIAQTGTLNAGTLAGNAVGLASFTGANAVGTLGDFTAGALVLQTGTSPLTVAGIVTAGTSISLSTPGSVFISGTIAPITGSTIAVGLTTGTLSISGLISDSGAGTTFIGASGGTITETGSLIAGTLTGAASVASLTGTGNTIATLGSFAAGDAFSLVNTTGLSVIGAVGGGSLAAISAPSIAVGDAVNAGRVFSESGGVISLRTQTLTAGAAHGTLSATGGTIEIAPGGTATAVALGGVASAGTLGFDTAAFVLTADELRVGAAGGTLSATGIVISGPTDVHTIGTLQLMASGAVTQTASLIAGKLVGTADSVALTTAGNTIASIGDVSAPHGFDLINNASLSVDGTLAGNSGTVVLNNNTFSLAVPGRIAATAATLNAGSIDLTGSVDVTGLVSMTASTGAISQATTAFLNARTLTGSASTTAQFLGSANTVGTIGAFSAPDGFTLVNAASLSAAGALTSNSGTVILNAGTFGLTIPGGISGTAVTLSAGSIDLSGSFGVSAEAAFLATGTINETGTLNAATLTGSAAAADFTGTNAIGTLSAFSVGGSLTLGDTSALTVIGAAGGGAVVALTGPSITIGDTATSGTLLVSSGGLISLRTDTLVAGAGGGALSASAGMLEVAPTGTTSILALGTVSSIGTLGFTPGSFAIAAETLRLGEAGGTVAASGITVAGPTDFHGVGTLDLRTTGAVTQTAALIAGTLVGTAASVGLTTAGNTLAAIGDFAAPGGFALTNASSLSVAGLLVSNAGSVVLDTGGSALSVPGTIRGTAAALSGGSIDIAGSLGVVNTALLTASGAMTEGGILSAGTLTGSATGSAGFTGTANAIATLGSFAAGPTLIVVDGGSLLVGGTVSASQLVSVTAPTLTVSGLAAASTTTLAATGGTLTLSGTVNASATADLSGSLGIAGAGGLVTGGSALHAASADGAVVLSQGSNDIASLAGSASTGFVVNDSVSLNVGHVVTGGTAAFSAPSLTISGSLAAPMVSLVASAGSLSVSGTVVPGSAATLSASGLLQVSGTIAPPAGTNSIALSLTGATIAIGGLVSDGGSGTTGLFATGGGTVAETGTLIVGALSGSVGVASLLGATSTANTIASLAGFNANILNLNDGRALTVGSTLTVGTSVSIVDSGSLLVSGTIAPLTGTTAIAVGLTAATLSITGLVSDGGFGTTGLNATDAGTITEAGSLIAGTLTGSAGVADLTGSNAIAVINGFAASQAFSLIDASALTVLGAVGGGSVVSVLAPSLTLGDTSVAGALVAASGGRVSVRAGTLVAGAMAGTLAAHLGTLEIAPFAATDVVALGTISSGGTLGFTPAGFSLDAATLSLGARNGTTASGSIAFVGATDLTGFATLDLRTSGSVTQINALRATALTGSADSVTLIAPGNAIASVGSFATVHGFEVTNNRSLTVTGLLTDSSGMVIVNAGSFGISLPGTIAAAAVTLTAGSIDIGGTVSVSGVASITASAGSIIETGALNAGTLTGGASGLASLTGTNTIGVVGNFAAGGLVLDSAAAALTVAGVVTAGTSVSIVKTGALLVSGTIAPLTGTTAIAVGLTAGSIGLTGLVSDGGAGTTALVASGGTITQTGTLIAGTLGGTATVAGFAGATAIANQVANLGGFTAERLTLNDGNALTVSGPVSIGTAVALVDSGLLSVTGTIKPLAGSIAVSLTAGTIAIPGLISDGGSGTTGLFATNAGTITEGAGTLVAGALTGNAGVADLAGSNTIASLGSFAAGSALTVNDTASLLVNGSVTAGTFASISAPTLSVLGLVAAPTATLTAVAGTLTIGGTVDAATTLALSGSLGIAGGGALILGGGPLGANSAGGSVVLSNASNAVASITGSAASAFSFADSASLTVGTIAAGTTVTIGAPAMDMTGIVTAPNVALTAHTGSLAISGAVDASSSATLTAGGLLLVSGTVAPPSGTTAIALGLTGGTISITGTVSDGGSGSTGLFATNAGTIVETGTLVAGSLSGSADVVSLTGSANAVRALGSFTATHGFTLIDKAALAVNGGLASNNGTVMLNTGTFGLTVPGTITGLAATFSAGSIDIGGSLDVSGVASLLANAGSIGETGFLSAGTLTGAAATTAGFSGSNSVGTLAAFTAPGGFLLHDRIDLAVTGSVASSGGTVIITDGTFALTVPGAITGNAATLSAGSIDLSGTVSVVAAASLAAAGRITETGVLNAATLTGSAGTTASFSGSNVIGTLDGFSAPNGFTLTDGSNLTQIGTLMADSGAVIINNGPFGLIQHGTITGNSLTLTAAGLTSNGTMRVTNTASFASAGTIDDSGALTAATLTGSAGTSASFTGGNTIASLADFDAPNGFTLNDSRNLVVSGLVTSNSGSVTLTDAGFTLTVPGTIHALGAVLSAQSLAIGGTLDATNIASLTAAGGITGTGVLNAGTLLGATSGIASFTGTNTVGVLGDFAATNGFTLTNRSDLSVAGSLTSQGSIAINDGTSAIGVPGAILGGSASFAAGAITIPGTLSAPGSAALQSSGTIAATGLVSAGTLTGSAASTAIFSNVSNSVMTLADFSATNGFTLANSHGLSIGGLLTSNGTVLVNNGTFALGIPGTVSANAATIASGALTIGGTLAVITTASLASSGSITETGVLNANTLTGSAATTASFTGINAVHTLAAFSAPNGFTLTNAAVLAVPGAVSASSGTVAIDNGGFALSIPGTISGSAASLSSGDLTIGGVLTIANTASLLSTGSIVETGILNVGTLTGRAATTAHFTGTNTIGVLDAFGAPGGLVLVDAANLTVAGAVGGGGTVVINDGTFALALNGAITATDATLSAGALTIGGTLAVTQTASLASTGSIAETGILNVGTLTGSAATTASFNGVNSIGTLGNFSAAALVLNNGSAPLNVAGSVNTGTLVSITEAGSLLVSGTIAPFAGTTAIAVGLTGSAIAISGLVSDGGAGTTALLSTAGTIIQTGSLIAGTLSGGALFNSGTVFSDARLLGTNHIGTLGRFSAATFLLNDTAGLTIAGPVVAQTATIASLGSILVNGSIGSCGSVGDTTLSATGSFSVASGALIWSLGGTVDLAAGAGFSQSGGMINGQDVVVHASTGAIAQTGGTIAAFDSVNLTATTGGFTEAGGVVTANGTITVLGASDFTIAAGTIIAGGALRVGTDGTLTITGGLLGAGAGLTIGGDTTAYSGGDVTQSGGTLAANGALHVRAGNNLSMTAGGTRFAGSLDVDSNGVTDSNLNGGAITVVLGGSLVYCAGLCIGTIAAGGGFAPGGLVAPGPLPGQMLTPGPLGGPLTIRGAAILIDQAEVGGTIDLIAHGNPGHSILGNINETGTGSVIATELTGLAQNHGSVAMNQPTNRIGTLAGFTADGDFRLSDQVSLQVLGPLSFGVANTGSVNIGNLTVLGSLTVPSGSTILAGASLMQANITLDTGTGAASGSIAIGGMIQAFGTVGSGGTIALTSAQSIHEETGTLIAAQLTGSSGNSIGSVLDAAVNLSGTNGATANNNVILTLGNFTANARGPADGSVPADLTLIDNTGLTVAGSVKANAGDISILAEAPAASGGSFSLTVANTGSVIATNAFAGGVPSNGNVTLAADGAITIGGSVGGGFASTVAIIPNARNTDPGAMLTASNTGGDAGHASVGSYFATGGSPILVRPGTITLWTDALALNAIGGTTVISAPDGMVQIGPRNATILSLDGVGISTTGTLAISNAALASINTNGILPTGLPGVGEVVIGSLDGGATSLVNAINITAGFSLPSIRTLGLFSNGAVTESGAGALAVNAVAGYGTALLLNGTVGNAVGFLGVPTRISTGGSVYQADTSVLHASASLRNFEVLAGSGTGSIRVYDTIGAMSVVGTLIAPAGQTIDLRGPSLSVDARQDAGIGNAGSLLVGTTAAPGQVLLAGDTLSIVGAGALVTALEGEVAITPYTASHTISIDNTGASSPANLSLGIADLARIRTRTAGDTAAAALGSQTLMIGSQDGGATLPNGGISINAALNLNGGGAVIANTLALYSTGSITGGGAVTVDSLTGRAGVLLNGGAVASGSDILLTGGNVIGTIGAVLPGTGTLTSGDLLASGAISVINVGNLVQRIDTTVLAGDDNGAATGHNTATLTVLAGRLSVNGTVQGGLDGSALGNVVLNAGNIVTAAAGVVAITGSGSVYAANGGSVGITAAGDIIVDGAIWGGRMTGALAGTVNLVAAGNIDEGSATGASTRRIGANLLTGSVGGHAMLLGDGSPTQNRIVNLGPFSTNVNGANDPVGFQLRDGRSLTVTGAVTDRNAGVSLAVAPPSGSGDIVLADVIAAQTVVKLQATGNILEASGGVIVAGTLTARGGIVPETETGAGTQMSQAVVFLGGSNQIATLGDLTATGNVLLNDGRDLTVNGTVLAGIGNGVGSAGSAAGAVNGPFGTTPASTPSPFAEIDVVRAGNAASGNLTIGANGVVQAGIDGAVTGNAALRAGSDTVAGSVTVNGGVYAAGAGTVSVSAGYNLSAGYNSVAGGSDIAINGTLAGDRGGLGAAGLVSLNAASSIDQTHAAALIAATTLTGYAGGHANLSETANGSLATTAPGNRIANLGSFMTNAGTDDPQGFLLRDGQALTVIGPVIDNGATASRGISIAVVPGSGAAYTPADLILNGVVSARTMVNAQATGNVYEQAGGTIVAGLLTSRAGLIPGTEAGGVLAATTAVGFLGSVNQIGLLGDVSATGNILVNNGQDLFVAGTIDGGTGAGSASGIASATSGAFGTTPWSFASPFVEIDVARAGAAASGNLMIGSNALLHAGVDGVQTGYVVLRAGSDTAAGSITLDGGVFASNRGHVDVTAGYNPNSGAFNAAASGSSIVINGTIRGDRFGGAPAGLVNLAAASSIDEAVAGAAIGAAQLTGHAGGHANLSEAPYGTLSSVASANRIDTLSAFVTNAGTADPQGFLLRDGQALTITGPVIDFGASASRGVSIAVVPGSGASYTPAELTFGGLVQAATTVNLQATGAVTQQEGGVIIAGTLTSQAGVIPSTETAGNTAGRYPSTIITDNASDFLGLAVNQIGTLSNVTSTGTLSISDALNLVVAGTVIGGVTPEAAPVSKGTLIGTGVSITTPGGLSITGTISVPTQTGVLFLSAGSVAFSGNAGPTLSANTMEIVAASGVSVGTGTTFYTGGDAFKRPTTGTAPVDPGLATPGAHFRIVSGGFQQSGLLTVRPYVATNPFGAVSTVHPELDIRLTTGAGAIAFDQTRGLSASSTSLLVTLGTGGSTNGRVVADAIALFYTGTFGSASSLFGTLHTASGTSVADSFAASEAFIARDGLYVPSNHFQVNGCAISSVNCVLISPFSAVPVLNPLKDLPNEFLGDDRDDPDLLVPNVSDRDE